MLLQAYVGHAINNVASPIRSSVKRIHLAQSPLDAHLTLDGVRKLFRSG
jgi:hypothetical protein